MSRVGGRYELLESLGAGAEGSVFRAVDQRTGQHVALKRLVHGPTRTELPRHPSVVAVLDHLEADGEAWTVMEWVDGLNLASRLARDGPLAAEVTIELLRPIGEALAYLHRTGHVHGDVKPANIVVTRGGNPVLVDFGDVGAGHGTDGYRAPEVTRGAWPGPAADVFGLAATAVVLLTGAPPGTGDDAQLASVSTALRRGLARQPERRPAPTELLRAITASVPSNLVASDGAFIGRRDALDTLGRLLHDARVVTITGIGGVGKTRLALETASRLRARYPAGVWLVRAERGTWAHPAVAFASALGLQAVSSDVVPLIARRLGAAPSLLVLDTAEPAPDNVGAFVDAVTDACTGLMVLATARGPLGVQSEEVYPLLPMPPDEARALADAVGTGREAAESGLPLAIRLGGSGENASIADVVDATLASLATAQRDALTRLSCFAMPWTREMAWQVARVGRNTLAAFRARGIVSEVGHRYRLVDLVADQLRITSAPPAPVRQRRQNWFLEMPGRPPEPEDLEEFLAVVDEATRDVDEEFLARAGDILAERLYCESTRDTGVAVARSILAAVEPGSLAAARARIMLARLTNADGRRVVEAEMAAIGDEVAAAVSRALRAYFNDVDDDDGAPLDVVRGAIDVFHRHGETRYEVAAGVLEATMVSRTVSEQRALDMMRDLLPAARALPHPWPAGDILAFLAFAANVYGDYDLTRQLATEAIPLLQQAGDRARAASTMAVLAFADTNAGRGDMREQIDAAALELAALGDDDWGGWLVVEMAYDFFDADPERGLLLFGAGSTLAAGRIALIGLTDEFRGAVSAARARFDPDQADRIVAAGKQLDLRQAVELLLAP